MRIPDTKSRLSSYYHSEMLGRIVNWCVAGNSRSEIKSRIKEHPAFETITNYDCDALINESKEILNETVSIDGRQIVNIHINYFEQIYKYFDSFKHMDGVLKCLRYKERMLGMIGGGKIVVNKTTTITIKPKVVYDTSRLSAKDNLRLEEIMQKATLVMIAL